MLKTCLLAFSFLSYAAKGWKCGGVFDQISELSPGISYSRKSTQDPLRVSWISDEVDLGNCTTYLDDSMSRASNYFKNALKVNQLQNNLILPGLKSCGAYSSIPEKIKTTGIPDTDLLIFIDTFNDSDVNYIARSGACAVDPGNLNQVLAGYISINSEDYHQSLSDETSLFTVLLHQVIHVLGFSRNLMKYWKTKSGSSYDPLKMMNSTSLRGIPKYVLITPAAVSAAQKHTGCSSYPGVELEEFEDSSIAKNHIDGFFSIHDLMSYWVTLDVYPSIYVAAILEDIGHFGVNLEYFFDPSWQRYVGCKFMTLRCIKEDYPAYPDFVCDQENSGGCDVSGVFRSKCEIDESIGDVKSYYRHFSNKKYGGPGYSDFCPIYNTAEGDICWGSLSPTDVTSEYGEQTGPDSVCMMSTIHRLPSTNTIRHSACYKVLSCSNSGTQVLVGDTTVTCPLLGGQITVPGYVGRLECPPANQLCSERPCFHACLGQGTCVMGTCRCNPGFSGPDCSIVCFKNCKTCLSELAKDCVTCLKDNFVAGENGCVCPSGFFLNQDGICLKNVVCENCEKCVEGNCLECRKNSVVEGDACVCAVGYKKGGSGVCDSCVTGYFERDYKCLQCAFPCYTCKDEKMCTSCLNGFVLFNSQCIKSDTCIESWYGNCLRCKPGYFLTSGNCEKCMTGCLSCPSKDICTLCFGDMILTNDICIFPEKCAEIDYYYFKCKSCLSGYYLADGICYSCESSCKSCICPSKCTECNGVFELSYDGGCLCPSSCQVCDFSKFSCISCNPGYFLENNMCIKCPPSCETCTSITKCLTCKSSYVLLSNFTCDCPENCVYCDKFDFTCGACKDKFYLESGKCLPCIAPCEKCVSAQDCTSCLPFLFLNELSRCICSLTCAKCDENLGCVRCHQGYYLSGQECKRCTDPCKICSGPNQCQDCLGHYLPDSNEVCKCPSCCVCDTETYFCRSPVEGYYLTNSGCSKCSNQCKSCSGSSITCTSCKGSLQLIGSECAWPLKCIKINQTTYDCLECDTNYVLDPITKQCYKCGIGCSCCFDNGGKCISCKGLYELNPNNSTECICPLSKCKECNSTTFMCKDCYPGFVLMNGTCENCNPICAECKNSTRTCTKCKGSFELDGSMCLCPKYCKSCNFDNFSCMECYDGYFLSNSACRNCSSPCKTCKGTNTTCTSCFNKYMLLNNTCNCPSNCEVCDTKLFACTRCKSGFVSIDGICKPCLSPCLTCIDTQYTCTSCNGSAVLDGTSCICSRNCKFCNSTSLQCNLCKEGFYFNSTICTPCHPTCKECSGPSSSNCTSCFNAYKPDKGVCVKPSNCETGDQINFICSNCTSGYFLKNGECALCNAKCKTCQGREDICLSCQGNLRQVDYRCLDPEGCLAMSNNTVCTKCDQGFVLINGTCFRCENNCLTCNITTKNCTSCSSAYIYSVSTTNLGICTPQPSCLSIIPYTLFCGVCSDEYFLFQGFCIACKWPCKRCLSKDYCLSCIPNYDLNNETGICSRSYQCTVRNSTSLKCQVCREGTYLSDGEGLLLGDRECHACTSSCKTCIGSPTNCTSCYSDFQVNARGQCCSRSCSFCYLGSETCMECMDGFYLVNGRCFQCELPCRTCNSTSTTCTSCFGSYEVKNLTCVCPSLCNQCNCSFLCTSCKSRSYLDQGACIPCSKNCTNCIQSNICTECDSGFVLDQGYCVCPQGWFLNSTSCGQCSKNCSTCIGQNNCTSCPFGYFLDKSSCLECNKSCTSCIARDKCTSCISGYVLNSASCLACGKNCVSCVSPGNCTKCYDSSFSITNGVCNCPVGRYLDGSSCSLCASGCSNCTGISSCVSCSKGYYLSSGQCLPCTKNCTSCSSPTSCTECAQGYFFDKNTCPNCSINCTSCTTLTNCSSCKPGFYLDKNTCTSCPKNCSACLNQTFCTQCSNQFYLKNNSCTNCTSNCEICKGEYCEVCKTNYRLTSTNNCTDRPIGCEIFDKIKNQCQVCESGFQLCLDGTCKPISRYLKNRSDQINPKCHEGCELCSNFEICDLCYSGYWNDENMCRPCLDGCEICKDSVTCQYCELGFVMNNWGLCEKCSEGCIKCDPKDRSCLSCDIGWLLDDEICLNCGEGCKSCNKFDGCLECESGYLRNNGKCYLARFEV